MRVIDQWQIIYSTKPCLRLIKGHLKREDPGQAFNTISSGGRIQQLDQKHTLLTVGDLENNGQLYRDLAQDPNTSYGKTIKINIIFTIT